MPHPKDYINSSNKTRHASERLKERFNIKPKDQNFAAMTAMIVQGKAELVEDKILKKIYKLRFMGKDIKVVYDTVNHKIVTVLF